MGYNRAKGNSGVHDDLTATALVLADGTTRIALVALDMLGMNDLVVDRVRSRLSPIEPVLCCSHTHSGPVIFTDEGSSRKNKVYINLVVDQIVAAVQDAAGRMAPVTLEYASGQGTIAINRRERMPNGHIENGMDPDGVIDRTVQVISITGLKGERVATIVNYACHGTVLGPDNLLASADWIWAMRARVEQKLGGLVMFLQGAAGNLNPSFGYSPDRPWDGTRAFEKVSELGNAMAEAVSRAVRTGCKPLQPLPLKMERVETWLPTESPATTARPPKTYMKPVLAALKLPGFMSFVVEHFLDQRAPWKQRVEARDGYWAVPVRMSALRIGELAILNIGAELFTELGLAIKAGSPGKYTLLVSLADSMVSYVHPAESHAQGGYEVDSAPLLFRYPSRLAATNGDIVLQAAQSLFRRL